MSAPTTTDLQPDEWALIKAYRHVKLSQFGRIAVEIHAGKPKLLEQTIKTHMS